MTSKRLLDDEIEKFLYSIESESELGDTSTTDENICEDHFVHLSDVENIQYSSDNESVEQAEQPLEDIEHLSDEDDVPLNILQEAVKKTSITTIPKVSLRGKNRYKWSSIKQKSHRYGLNIVHTIRGPTKGCKNITDPLLCFKKFFNDEIINEIVQWTNVELKLKMRTDSDQVYKETNFVEISALLGVLILSAAMNNNHLTVSELFDSTYSGSRYVSVMSGKRFSTLLGALRFDDKSDRVLRISDKLAPIRKVWDLFIGNCCSNYKPGPYLTIDEQLLAFRGRVSFKMYIPNKPAKYGLKIMMLCDSGTKYMLNAIPYLGKGSNTTTLPLAEYFVKELSKPIYGSNRNITMDNWFTSIPLAKNLLKEPYKLTIVGTLRANKPEIPPEFRNNKNRPINTSMFCYDNELTLVSFKPKPDKIVYLLSSCNEVGTVNDSNKKPTMVEFYNSTKGGVDTFDQMCSIMSCSRKTNRWPMCLFYGMINMAIINSYIIYSHNVLDNKKKPLSRREFAKKLHCDLVKEHVTKRLTIHTLQTNLKRKIQNVLEPEILETPENYKTCNKRSNCKLCPYKNRRMTKSACNFCKKSICGEHKIEVCSSCANLMQN